jgi:hypothetical protein
MYIHAVHVSAYLLALFVCVCVCIIHTYVHTDRQSMYQPICIACIPSPVCVYVLYIQRYIHTRAHTHECIYIHIFIYI